MMPKSTSYRYNAETILAAEAIQEGCISYASHRQGMLYGEPLIVALDCLLKFAQAYRTRYECALSDDGVIGQSWLQAIRGIRELMDGNGALAMFRDISTDTKDNGACERVFWKAMEIAGFTESDLS